jgi:predicted DNA-binding protein (MmcQ/YjbR family)
LEFCIVYVEGNVPDDVLRDMEDKSYELILGALSKKAQKEILEGCK